MSFFTPGKSAGGGGGLHFKSWQIVWGDKKKSPYNLYNLSTYASDPPHGIIKNIKKKYILTYDSKP